MLKNNFGVGLAKVPQWLHGAPQITFTSLSRHKNSTVSDYVWYYLNKEGYIRTTKQIFSTYEQEIYKKNGWKFKLRRYLYGPNTLEDKTNPCRFVWEVESAGFTEIISPGCNQAGQIINAVKNNTPNITITRQGWARIENGKVVLY